jgi:hypothetical protein
MNQLFQVFDRQLCEACGDKDLAERKLPKIPPGAVARLSDPTVCAFCKSDHGALELARAAELPICPACEKKVMRPTLPGWVQMAALAIVLLAGVELSRNWRLFQAYFEIPRAHRALAKGDAETAWHEMGLAAAHVPEMPELHAQEQLMHAFVCLRKGDFDQAIALFESVRHNRDSDIAALADLYGMVAKVDKCLEDGQDAQALKLAKDIKARYPQSKEGDRLIESAEIGMAFTNKDYATFEAKARQVLQREPNDPGAIAQVASALACQYAATGQDKYKTEALAMLEQARQNAGAAAAGLKEYEERILHRLNTREVIDKKEYNRRFRSGPKGTTTCSSQAG